MTLAVIDSIRFSRFFLSINLEEKRRMEYRRSDGEEKRDKLERWMNGLSEIRGDDR